MCSNKKRSVVGEIHAIFADGHAAYSMHMLCMVDVIGA